MTVGGAQQTQQTYAGGTIAAARCRRAGDRHARGGDEATVMERNHRDGAHPPTRVGSDEATVMERLGRHRRRADGHRSRRWSSARRAGRSDGARAADQPGAAAEEEERGLIAAIAAVVVLAIVVGDLHVTRKNAGSGRRRRPPSSVRHRRHHDGAADAPIPAERGRAAPLRVAVGRHRHASSARAISKEIA